MTYRSPIIANDRSPVNGIPPSFLFPPSPTLPNHLIDVAHSFLLNLLPALLHVQNAYQRGVVPQTTENVEAIYRVIMKALLDDLHAEMERSGPT